MLSNIFFNFRGTRFFLSSTAIGACLIAGSAANAQDPSSLGVDPEAAERALERTLVESGVLLLPQGALEIEPSLTFQYSSTEEFILGNVGGDAILDRQVVESTEVTAALDVRYGLPGDAQLEISLPLIYADRSIEEGVFAVGDEGSEAGIGDVRVGFAKTLRKDTGFGPDIVGRLTWDSDIGKDPDGPVSISSDFNEIQGALAALWRLDPVALSVGVVYEHALEKDDLQPGDVFGFSVGASLAASPTVALGMRFNASRRAESTFEGAKIEDSDQNLANIAFSVSSVVRRNALINMEFGAGLTDDSPDYFFSVSLPIRR